MTQETQTGTLEELDVKPGDVVECESVTFKVSEILGDRVLGESRWPCGYVDLVGSWGLNITSGWRIVSRATPADATPPTWCEMTGAEKGALLLAELDGECLEQKGRVIVNGESLLRWAPKQEGCWLDNFAYRIKPEPLVETVTAYAQPELGGGFEVNSDCDFWPFRITFTTTNGEPDLDSIKMERVNG